MCDSTVTFPGLTFTLTLQLGRRAVNPAPLIGARGKFTSEKVWKDGANGVMEMTPAASRDGRALQGSEPPPCCWVGTPGSAAIGGSQSKSPSQLQGSSGLAPVFPMTPGPHGPRGAGALG